jgi:hypothetical protein
LVIDDIDDTAPHLRHGSPNRSCYIIDVDPIGELLTTSRPCLSGEVFKAVFEFTTWTVQSAKAKNAHPTLWLINR